MVLKACIVYDQWTDCEAHLLEPAVGLGTGGSAGHLHVLGGDDAVELAHFADEVEGAPGKAVHNGVRVGAPAVGQPICAA